MSSKLTSVKRQHVALTGRACKARFELQRMIQSMGGTVSLGRAATSDTTVDVRGSLEGRGPANTFVPVTRQEFESVAGVEGPLDREHSTMGRIEQAFLRQQLFQGAEEAACAMCGRVLPISLLVAAHIKRRSECLRDERLDAENIAFSLCLLGCDALYEQGLIGVRHRGQICSSGASASPNLQPVLSAFSNRKCPAWNDRTAKYFDWHLRHRFQG